MRTRVIVPAILSAVMLSAPVFAANNISSPGKATNPAYKTVAMTAAEKCTKL